ncbi:MAG: CAP domain-containing protein [Acidobacteria bacterium]|nr:CAP domain-containing protein [Acidobacteriota bacterium]
MLRTAGAILIIGFTFLVAVRPLGTKAFSRSSPGESSDRGKLGPIKNLKYSTEPTRQEKSIFTLVNEVRKKEKLRIVEWDPVLWKMAEYYSRKMAEEGFFDHLDPDGNSVADRAKQFKVRNWTKIGENLFYADGFITPTGEAVRGWMNSEGHRENMLDRDWTHSAIGVYETRGRKTYITQLFLRRQDRDE